MDKCEWSRLYNALDVESSNVGDALGELNRTGWKNSRSEQLTSDEQRVNPEDVWHRRYARKQTDTLVEPFGS